MNNEPSNITILGCTGSIGETTLGVMETLGVDRFQVIGLSAGQQLDKLISQALRWRPKFVSVAEERDEAYVRGALTENTKVISGENGLREIAAQNETDIVVNGLVGAVGLLPTLDALCAGKTVGMANKEPLVMAGGLILETARRHGGRILPLDSEPNAVWQCLQGHDEDSLKRIMLTASGGPFRGQTKDQMVAVTSKEALAHPTWQMGEKITVDSATLMNKGFEVIEASCLFSISIDQVDVVVHRESIVHSMVEFKDGSWLAHLGKTDMALPIQYALTHPGRQATSLEALDLVKIGALHFEEPDLAEFPCLQLCYEVGRAGGCFPTALIAADEIAVQAFLEDRIGFLDIFEINSDVCDRLSSFDKDPSLEDVLDAYREARELAKSCVHELSRHRRR